MPLAQMCLNGLSDLAEDKEICEGIYKETRHIAGKALGTATMTLGCSS